MCTGCITRVSFVKDFDQYGRMATQSSWLFVSTRALNSSSALNFVSGSFLYNFLRDIRKSLSILESNASSSNVPTPRNRIKFVNCNSKSDTHKRNLLITNRSDVVTEIETHKARRDLLNHFSRLSTAAWLKTKKREIEGVFSN